jgi:hypothetical protein
MVKPLARGVMGTAVSFLGAWALTGWLDDLGFGASAKAVVWVLCAAVIVWLWLTDDDRHTVRRQLYHWRRTRPILSLIVASIVGAIIAPVLWWVITLRPPTQAAAASTNTPTTPDAYLAVGITAATANFGLAYISEIKREGIKVDLILRNETIPDVELENVAGQFWVQTKYLIATIRKTQSPLDHPWEKDGAERVQYRIWYTVLPKMSFEWLPTLVFALPPEGETALFGAQLVSKTTKYRQFRWVLSNKDGKPVLSGGDATPASLK